MPIFVTGGTGFIGRSVVRELRRRTHVVRALARSDAAAATLRDLGAEPVRGDLRDVDLVRREVQGADALVHCAFERSAENVPVERAFLEAALDALPDGRTVVYTSGAWVYGSRGDALVAEDAPLDPLPLVAWRPVHEQLVLSQGGRLRAIVVRAGTVYGDGGGIPGGMVAQARDGTLRIVGDGANRWATVRHDALAELYGLALDRRTARGVYNAARGAAVPYAAVANAAMRAAGREDEVPTVAVDEAVRTMGPFAAALACDLQLDAGRAERDLGWTPHRPTLLEELAAGVVV